MAETFTLDGLDLNDGTTFAVNIAKGADMTPPRQRPEYIGAADSESQLLVRAPLHENRRISLPMVIVAQATRDLVYDKVGQIVDKLQKASRYTDGIALVWSTGTRSVTFDVLAGEIAGLPLDWENGWAALSPEFSIELTCKPYWRGTRTVYGTTATASTPAVTLEIPNVPGDVPALGELIVTDMASQSRRHVEWGLEGPLTYNSGTSLLIDSDSLVTSGFSGSGTTFAGSYDPNAAGNNAITAPVYPSASAVAGTGNQSHIGSFRVKARCAPPTLYTEVRFSWRAGDGPMVSNPWVTARATYNELDLGSITIPPVISGTQRWTGQVEVRDTAGGTGAFILDYLLLVPTTDGYGKARASYAYSAGAVVGQDSFTGTTAGSALNARVAPAGGTWATSGSATDFAFADDLSGEQIKRSTTSDASPRFAVLGATNYTDTQVEALVLRSTTNTSGVIEQGVIARWVDSSNYLRAVLSRNGTTSDRTLSIIKRVAGSDTTLASVSFGSLPGWVPNVYWGLRLIVFASGRALAWLLDSTKTTVYQSVEASDSVLATAGTLASGKPGIYDMSTWASSLARYYDDFTVATPAAEPIAIYSGRTLQVRYDDTIRDDSTATYTGRPPSYRGSRFLLPPGTSRVLAKARRNDIDVNYDDQVTDSTKIQVAYTPRGLAVPR